MFMTFAYSFIFSYKWVRQQYMEMFYLRMIRNYLPHSSVVLTRHFLPRSNVLLPSVQSVNTKATVLSENVPFELSVIESQVLLSLNGWTQHSLQRPGFVSFLINLLRSPDGSLDNQIPVNSLCDVIAVKPGNPQSLVAQCAPDDFDKLVRCYLCETNRLTSDSGLVSSLTTVQLINGDRVAVKDADTGETQKTGRASGLRRKPPNILIYCGKKDSSRLYETVKSVICQCVNTSLYTVYHLKHDHVTTTPWCDNTALLVIASDKAYDGVDRQFLNYFLGGGSLISFGCAFDSLLVQRRDRTPDVKGLGVLRLKFAPIDDVEDVAVICTRYCYDVSIGLIPGITVTSVATDRSCGEPVIVEATQDSGCGVAILSQVNLDKDPVEMAISNEIFTLLKRSNTLRFQVLTNLFTRLGVDCSTLDVPSLTSIHLLSKSEVIKKSFLESIESRLRDDCLVSKDLTLQFVDNSVTSLSVTATHIPVLTSSQSASTKSTFAFDFNAYCQHLHTSVLGNTVLFADVITTTMTLFEGLMFSCPDDVGLVAVARRQVAGKGRGGNTWLSPVGCAMFSLLVRVPLSSALGQRISCIQHLMALAVVLAVRQKPGCESAELRIKWPNDIYFGRDIKLGGIIVKSSVMGNMIHANIGCGVNVTNKDPTMCINDALSRITTVSKADWFSVEELIARTVTCFEQLVTEFQTAGQQSFYELYYKHWLHSDSTVRLGADSGPLATVVGLDEYGFLVVKLSTDGSTVTVQPDGNSFDMMRNLILPKNN